MLRVTSYVSQLWSLSKCFYKHRQQTWRPISRSKNRVVSFSNTALTAKPRHNFTYVQVLPTNATNHVQHLVRRVYILTCSTRKKTYRPTTTRNEFLQVLRTELLCFDGLDFLLLQTKNKVSVDVTYCYTIDYVVQLEEFYNRPGAGWQDDFARLVWSSRGRFFLSRSSVQNVLPACEN